MPALLAVLAGAVVCAILFVPFVAVSYRHRGRITGWRALGWAAAVVYGFGLWAYTLVPFPEPGKIECTRANLRPFEFVRDFLHYPHSGVATLVHNPVLLQVGLNVVLFMPLGFLVRALGRRGWLVAAGAGFGLSALVELTQLTGVWGLYPCSYRVFDVDDLLANTAGAVVGSVAAWLVPAFRSRLEAAGTADGVPPRPDVAAPVTKWRRLVAMVCDGFGCAVVMGVVSIGLQAFQVYGLQRAWDQLNPVLSRDAGWLAAFALQACLVFVTGGTLGDQATRLIYIPEGSDDVVPTGFGRRLVRLLAGMGGVCLLQLLPTAGFAGALAFVCLAALPLTARGRGLPGVLGRQALLDSRPARAPRHEAGQPEPALVP
jgi:hypothetical protein